MQTTIIYAHPWEGSYNHAILDKIKIDLTKQGKDYTVIDLYEDEFNPVLAKHELAVYAKGEGKDPLVQKYQQILTETTELIILFPIWWYEIPAILKGFFDKVMLNHFSYEEGKLGLVGQLTQIKKATIITTATSPKWYLRYFKGNYVKNILMKGTLKDMGIKKMKWLHVGNVKGITQIKRQKFLANLSEK
ncbi:NAD(P)H-dependent oxidoreductase [Isobaculum melis]|uniref:Putative NADPH-quinone reductase (Modulator of drug activity B) n=1 Tax=Isobaculum melis TaxID=142588 RepID=A0A1H9STG2_9LACT|nr:NAD(P)H-dependent oxidoreductase [Isobaculum melis]SER88154.1 Putative NADPH-quinone reductase (modulator of drug activity B) [Isobaculum melis]